GYYAYDVQPDVGEGDAPKALVKIAPGPRFVLGSARIDWIGAAPDPAANADAKAQPRQVTVDHADNTVNPDYRIAAGPLVHLDSIQLNSKGRTHPEWL